MVEAQKEAQREEELDRQARLGPGGLDPVEVFESLPDVSTYHIPLNDVLKFYDISRWGNNSRGDII